MRVVEILNNSNDHEKYNYKCLQLSVQQNLITSHHLVIMVSLGQPLHMSLPSLFSSTIGDSRVSTMVAQVCRVHCFLPRSEYIRVAQDGISIACTFLRLCSDGPVVCQAHQALLSSICLWLCCLLASTNLAS